MQYLTLSFYFLQIFCKLYFVFLVIHYQEYFHHIFCRLLNSNICTKTSFGRLLYSSGGNISKTPARRSKAELLLNPNSASKRYQSCCHLNKKSLKISKKDSSNSSPTFSNIELIKSYYQVASKWEIALENKTGC